MNKLSSAAVILTALTVWSCNRDQEIAPINTPDKRAVDVSAVKESDMNALADRLKQVALVLGKVYENPVMINEMNNAIYTGYYVDESVELKDLLHPERSPIYKFESLNNARKGTAGIGAQFIEIL